MSLRFTKTIPLPRGSKFADLTGRTFSLWEVLGYAGKVPRCRNWEHVWLCQCKCGTKRAVRHTSLVHDKSKNCRDCPLGPFRGADLVGRRYGFLDVLSYAGFKRTGGQRKSLWACFCRRCGHQAVIAGAYLENGDAVSCGCFARSRLAECNTTHGFSRGGRRAKILISWDLMKRRCIDRDCPDYKNYGGRGIRVCPGFLCVMTFVQILGVPPKGHSLDRIDNDGHYSCGQCKWCRKSRLPMNCRWATRKQQNENKRNNRWIEYADQRKTLTAWARFVGISVATLSRRLAAGWPVEKAVTTPGVKANPNRRPEDTMRNIWYGIKQRCLNENAENYHLYGGRGIRVCNRWANSFFDFANDMSLRPSLSHSLDRIDNEGHYSCGVCSHCRRERWPSNCRWATPKQQCSNRRSKAAA